MVLFIVLIKSESSCEHKMTINATYPMIVLVVLTQFDLAFELSIAVVTLHNYIERWPILVCLHDIPRSARACWALWVGHREA